MNILGHISPEDFLAEYWQKKPLLIRNAFPDFKSPLSAEELAGLSCEEDVESRIIIEKSTPTPWQLMHGPFSEVDFARLPDTHWTLLVQAVDQWVPEVSDLLENFNFIPNWRLDDIMISYAPKGGSVGPHFDNYDVFLLQAEGERRWQLGSLCNDETPCLKHPDLRILEMMDVKEEWILTPGDMLYLPPLYAHFGVAENHCMTYSIGFRAPSLGDIAANFGDYLANNLPDENRYQDKDLALQKNPGEISAHTLSKLKQTIDQLFDNPEHLARWFGEYMTTLKYPNPPEDEIPTYTEEMWLEEFNQCKALRKEEDARFAYHVNQESALFFANGISLPCEQNLLPLIELLCAKHEWTRAELEHYVIEPHNLLLLATLMSINSLYFI